MGKGKRPKKITRYKCQRCREWHTTYGSPQRKWCPKCGIEIRAERGRRSFQKKQGGVVYNKKSLINKNTKEPDREIKICEWCGKSYTPKSNNQKFCKLSCKTQASRSWKTRIEPPKIWRCSHCGSENKLRFNILENKTKWRDIKCLSCNKKRQKKSDISVCC